MSAMRLYAATGETIVRLDSDDGHAWTSRTVLDNGAARCLAVDPADPEHCYAGTMDKGLFRSRDGGESWQAVDGGIPHATVMSIVISRVNQNGPVVFAGTEPSSIYRSDDDGATWQDLATLREIPSQPTWSFPPRPWTSHVRWMAAHPTDPAVLYAGIELGGVMTTRDGGASWEDHKAGAYSDCHALATHRLAPERVYEAAGQGVAWSHDAGRTWNRADEGMPLHYAWGLAVDSSDPELWYVSAASGPGRAHGRSGDAGAGLYRKRGAGPWESITGGPSGLPSPLPYMPYALVAPKSQAGTLIVAFQHGEIWQSPDAGDTWTQLEIDNPLPAIDALVEA
jgi:photosystem II stability/assembly factor-like uncharacterized protein